MASPKKDICFDYPRMLWSDFKFIRRNKELLDPRPVARRIKMLMESPLQNITALSNCCD